MNTNHDPINQDDEAGLVVRKTAKQYHIKGHADLPLSRRELTILLKQSGSTVEDIGLMFTYFQVDQANEAHFGILGDFIYATQYKD